MVLSARIAVAGPMDGAVEAWLGSAALGQAASTAPSEDKSMQAADLLRRARQAMAENDLAAAESLISQAEALGVQYNGLYLGDTPKKARRDLERKRSAAGPTKPSQLFAPLGLNRNKQAPTADPFAGRPAELPSGLPEAGRVTPLPSVNATSQVRSPSAQGPLPMAPTGQLYPTMQPGENEIQTPGSSIRRPEPPAMGRAAGAPAGLAARPGNDSPLRVARLALAVGDVRRAGDLVQQAKALRINYQPLDDTPERVEAAIRKYQDLSSLDKNTEAYRRAYARNLMEQSDALVRWGEPDEAERLAGRAAGMQITYGPFEAKPQDILERIAAARRQGGRPTAPPSSPPGFADAASGLAPSASGLANASSGSAASLATRQRAVELVRQAREAMAADQFDRAEQLARQAEQLRLPESAFAPGEDRPGLVLLDLRQLRQNGGSGVVPAGGQFPVTAAGGGESDRTASRAVYDPSNDPTRNVAAAIQQPVGRPALMAQNQPTPAQPPAVPPEPGAAGPAKTPGMALFEQGEAALKAHDTERAYQLFRQAAGNMNDLDPMTAQRLQDHLQLLSVPSRTKPQNGQAPTMADETAARQRVLANQVATDLAHKESNARAMRDANPKAALAMLEEARKKVEASGLDSAARDQLLRRVDRAIGETKQFIEENRPQIELTEKNNRTRQDVDRSQRVKVEVGEKLALMIDDFNKAMDEQRYEQALLIAKRANELAPNEPVVQQILWQAKFVQRFQSQMAIKDQKEQGFVNVMEEVDRASIPFAGDKNPMVFPDAKDWGKLIDRRSKHLVDSKRRRTEREVEIDKKLRTPVSLQFTNAPLAKVMDYLAKLAEVNLYLDPQGLAEEGVTTDTPVTIEVRHEIMLKSALNLILQPLHLSYVVKDEVLKVTSEQMRDGQVYTTTYNVADLVIPIPNFVPQAMGLQSAYTGAMANVGFGGGGSGLPFASSQATPLAVVAKGGGASVNPATLAQMASPPHGGGGNVGAKNVPVGAGPGGLGGGAQADFDSLIDLITSTVKPTTWDAVGGPGSIAPFETNLSIVVSQTQEVHEEIVDLLEQLRRLQDLQVTIEVRFITLNDNFFERIGVDFDFNIQDNLPVPGMVFGSGTPPNITTMDQGNRTITVGMSAPNVFNADLDIPFTQNSFGLAVPQFGGFDAAAGAQLGFAILSDIEAFFFINAAQGDRRSNVLQAPKVTLFNGQQAFVSDTSQSPFVISVIPVVGDFAAAQQPVIVVLSEGTFMTVQAVISNDRRFVRLTVVPFFSKIGKDVPTFQFSGSTTTTTDATRDGLQAAATDPAKLWNKKGDNATTTQSGTTVQLPTFSFVTVTTTVSVPDGGTVLLGGIKRLSEGRNEFGVPMLNKLPYINRLFKNVGIGRETQSLMMMVTPRIIIQEEEEEKLGIQQP
jgi:general secretion pathway protein D